MAKRQAGLVESPVSPQEVAELEQMYLREWSPRLPDDPPPAA
jgi:hypothetical protein